MSKLPFTALVALAVAGVLAGFAFAVIGASAVIGFPLAVAVPIYVAGVVSMLALTAGARARPGDLWTLRLAAPLGGAVAVWVILTVIGL
ncbi:hypothetical protein [Pelagibacterium montanilacus]|uniref:hypothetical protein n=1 Tax=Pelagibacterium montanilacus TaxID=2185280 RepID=UPI000F8DE037|nr:hypothetical protein [Pelagibacterium montanilacus]